MHIYFSGIGGVAIGPLARFARDVGYDVTGSDSEESRYTKSVEDDGIKVHIGQTKEDIEFIHKDKPIDWFVHTAAIKPDHPELQFVKENNIKSSKRDEFINHVLKEKDLKLIAMAGTHGKTNTTGMLIWMFKQLEIASSYSIGTNIEYGPNGQFQDGSKYFLYEADEFDRNFLSFKPFASIFTAVDYDHPETYSSVEEYKKAFRQFADNSESLITWRSIADYLDIHEDITHHIINDIADGGEEEEEIILPGETTRKNAFLALTMMKSLFPELDRQTLLEAINTFPGTERRMEKLSELLYTDYAHHPIEIKTTLDTAAEFSQNIVVVYQPHQNIRQHNIQNQYIDVFNKAQKVYWLPTYLSREQFDMPVITQEQLISKLSNPEIAEPAEMGEALAEKIQQHRQSGELVLLLSAGDLDDWARENLV